MIDLYLRADTEAAMNAALIEAGLAVEQDGALQPTEGVALDIIGPIHRVTGMDDDGEPVVQSIASWHVNLRAVALTDEQAAIMQPFEIAPPNQPFRVWADG